MGVAAVIETYIVDGLPAVIPWPAKVTRRLIRCYSGCWWRRTCSTANVRWQCVLSIFFAAIRLTLNCKSNQHLARKAPQQLTTEPHKTDQLILYIYNNPPVNWFQVWRGNPIFHWRRSFNSWCWIDDQPCGRGSMVRLCPTSRPGSIDLSTLIFQSVPPRQTCLSART